MTITCWNCKKAIDTSGMNCPHCNVMIEQAVLDQFSGFHVRSSPPSPVKPGVVIAERYHIKGELGRGGMGIVYLAHDNYMERDVALKIIPQELSMDPKAIADLKRETALALELTHEYIVRLYNLDNWKNLTYVTMEYVPCGTLSHLMVKKGGRLSLKEALPILKQVAEALDYTHRKNPPIMHLDIKPLNILIDNEGNAKIADYGLARVLRDLATRISAWEAAGTLAYMAPEQIRGKGIGPWSDIYALTAVAYELLSGYPPFHTGDMRWQIMHEEVDPISYIPESVNNALLCGLRKDTSARPDSAGDLVAMLEGKKAVPSLTVDTETDSGEERRRQAPAPVAEKKRSAGRNQLLPVLIILLLVLTALVGWELWNRFQLNSITLGPSVAKETHPIAPLKIPPQEKASAVAADKKPDVPVAPTAGDSPEVPSEAVKIESAAVADTLTVISTPSDAEVYIDDVGKGTTPLVLQGIKAGDYKFRIVKEGYQAWERDVTVDPSQKSEISARLDALKGKIEIITQPEGIAVLIDGKSVGKTPFVMDSLAPGLHVVTLEAEGFQKWRESVAIKGGETLKIAPLMKTLAGDLKITSDPSQAMVFVGGRQQGLTPYVLSNLNSGNVRIEVRKDCYKSAFRDIAIRPARLSESHFKLTPVCGNIQIDSRPSGARWYLDNKDMGITPAKMNDVKIGRHTVRFVMDKFEPRTLSITVKAGENDPVVARLEAVILEDENLFLDPVTQMVFVWVEKGCYKMGSSGMDPERNVDEGPAHDVCVDGFWIGRYEVTQAEWQRVMGNNPSTLKIGDNYPVVNISWNDVQAFINKLNAINKGKYVFRLPTEAEWEYACRSRGKAEPYSGSHQVDLVAWYQGNSNRSLQTVGKKAPNGIGLYDMSGNVYEWVADYYASDAYARHAKDNPLNRTESKYRVCRGGSWLMRASECRSTNRSYYYPESRNYNLGFRLVRTQ